MKKKTFYLLSCVFYALSAIGWLWASLQSLEVNKINAAVIVLGWTVFCLAAYTMYEEYKNI